MQKKKIMKLTLVERSKNQKNQHIRTAELYKNKRIFSNSSMGNLMHASASHNYYESRPCHIKYPENLFA